MQSLILASFLGPSLYHVLGTSMNVTVIVTMTLPCLGFGANMLAASLVFTVQRLGYDPAVIVGPLLTTLVDSFGLLTYLAIATAFLNSVQGEDLPPMCEMQGFGRCVPANAFTTSCKLTFPLKCVGS